MKALITGAKGFVGAYLAKELVDHGHTVLLSDHSLEDSSALPYFQAELDHPDAVDALVEWANPDAVIHLAGISDVKGSGSDDRAKRLAAVNIGATQSICEALIRRKKPTILLFASTGLVYKPNQNPNFSGYTEDSELGPVNDYGWSKLSSECLLRLYDQSSLRCYIVRPFNHIGPNQDARFVCPALANRIFNAKNGTTIPVGNMNNERDFSDVRDIVRAYRLILEMQPEQRLFVLGSGKPTPIKKILNFFLEYSGKNLTFQTDAALLRTEHDCVFGNASCAREVLGWEAVIPLEQSLREIYNSISQSSLQS